jgi:hypothetical protein
MDRIRESYELIIPSMQPLTRAGAAMRCLSKHMVLASADESQRTLLTSCLSSTLLLLRDQAPDIFLRLCIPCVQGSGCSACHPCPGLMRSSSSRQTSVEKKRVLFGCVKSDHSPATSHARVSSKELQGEVLPPPASHSFINFGAGILT